MGTAGHAATVDVLIGDLKLGPEDADDEGRTPLHAAAAQGHDAVCSVLIEKGKVNVNSQKLNGCSPLWSAAQHGRHSTVDLLVAAGAELDLSDTHGASPLHVAACQGHTPTVSPPPPAPFCRV